LTTRYTFRIVGDRNSALWTRRHTRMMQSDVVQPVALYGRKICFKIVYYALCRLCFILYRMEFHNI